MEKNDTSSGIGWFGALAIVFITLKLIGIIDWSWVWVLSPIWIPIVLGVCVLVFFIFIWLAAGIIKGLRKHL